MGKEKKQAYITIGLPTETLTILKRFMEVEGLTTKEIFAEIADAYMVARDEELITSFVLNILESKEFVTF